MSVTKAVDKKTDILLRALARGAIEARCNLCGAIEFVIPLDEPIDDLFIANYHCDDCDRAGGS